MGNMNWSDLFKEHLDTEPKYGPIPVDFIKSTQIWDLLTPQVQKKIEVAGALDFKMRGDSFADEADPEAVVRETVVKPFFDVDCEIDSLDIVPENRLKMLSSLKKADYLLKTTILQRSPLVEVEPMGGIKAGISQIKDWLPEDDEFSYYKQYNCGVLTDGYHYLFYLPDPTYETGQFKWLNLNLGSHQEAIVQMLNGAYDLKNLKITEEVVNTSFQTIVKWIVRSQDEVSPENWYLKDIMGKGILYDPEDFANQALLNMLLNIIFMRFMEELGLYDEDYFRRELLKGKNYIGNYNRVCGELGRTIGGPFYTGGANETEPVPGRWKLPNDNVHAIVNLIYEQMKLCASDKECADPTNRFNMDVMGHLFERINNALTNETEKGKINHTAVYTPENVTAYMAKTAIDQHIAKKLGYGTRQEMLPKNENGFFDLSDQEHEKILEIVSSMTIVDPAAGSGAFMTAAYDYLTKRYLLSETVVRGKSPPAWKIYQFHKNLIENQLFANEIMPMATKILKMRLYLALMSDAHNGVVLEMLEDEKFDNLNKTISCGDALVGFTFADIPTGISTNEEADDAFKKKYSKYADIIEKTPMIHWPIQFPSVAVNGGFDVVLMNPPYAGPHKMAWLKDLYGAKGIKKYNELTSQSPLIKPGADMAVKFVDRCLDLTSEGLVSSIQPSTYLTAPANSELRNHLAPHLLSAMSFPTGVIWSSGVTVRPAIETYDLGTEFALSDVIFDVDRKTYQKYNQNLQEIMDAKGWELSPETVIELGLYPSSKGFASIMKNLSDKPNFGTLVKSTKTGLHETNELGLKQGLVPKIITDKPVIQGKYLKRDFQGIELDDEAYYLPPIYTNKKGQKINTDDYIRKTSKYQVIIRVINSPSVLYPTHATLHNNKNQIMTNNITYMEIEDDKMVGASIMILESAVMSYLINKTRGNNQALSYGPSIEPIPIPELSRTESWETLNHIYPWSQSLTTEAEIAQFRRVLNRVALEAYFSESSDVAEAVLACGDTAAAEELSLEPFLELLMNEPQTREFYDLLVSKGYEFVSEPEDDEVVVMSAEAVTESFRPVIRFGMATAGVLGVISLVQWLQSLRDD